jgi:hypothetical protein
MHLDFSYAYEDYVAMIVEHHTDRILPFFLAGLVLVVAVGIV